MTTYQLLEIGSSLKFYTSNYRKILLMGDLTPKCLKLQ